MKRAFGQVGQAFQKVKGGLRNLMHGMLHDVFAGVEIAFEAFGALLPKTRKSNPLSKLLRPILMHKRVRAALGAQLAGAMILVGSVSADPGDLEAYPIAEVPVIAEEAVVVVTEERFTDPIEKITGTSQGFHAFHRGIDLRAPFGTKVGAISKGKVTEVSYGRFAYGHYVLVEHEGGFASLYAHLDKILVKTGDEVSTDEALGTVGLTGWTTGPHLHLEVYEEGRAINPKIILR